MLLYDSKGNLLDSKEFTGSFSGDVGFENGPDDSVLVSYNGGWSHKVLKLDLASNKIISETLFD